MVCWNTEEKLASESKIPFYVVLILIQNENVLHFKRGRFGRYKIQRDKGYVSSTLRSACLLKGL